MQNTTRRTVLKWAGVVPLAMTLTGIRKRADGRDKKPSTKSDGRMQLGLVTYNWGRGWDIATIITKKAISSVAMIKTSRMRITAER